MVYTTSDLGTGYGMRPRPTHLASPFTDGQLQEIVWSDIFGQNSAPISRADAMSVPALHKARNLICGTIAQFPLVLRNRDGVLPDEQQPSFLYRTDGVLSPYLRMLFTLDDLLFYGSALWERTNGSDGFPIRAERVPFDAWQVNAHGAIVVRDRIVDANEVIHFMGPDGGLLNTSASAIRSARSIESNVEKRTGTPVPIMELSVTDYEANLSTTAAKALVKAYNDARRDPEGATVLTPYGVELRGHGDKADAGSQVQGQNAARISIANITGVPVALLDGSTSASSLTYSTQEGRRNEFVDYALSIWIKTIEGRLSADDVVPAGLSVAFDQTEFLATVQAPTPDRQD